MTIGRKIRFGFYIALFALFVIAIISFHGADELTATTGLVTHTVEVLRQLEGLDARLLESESAARGYGLTGDSSSQQTIKTAPVLMSQQVRALISLTADNPNQQRRLEGLERALDQRLIPLKKISELRPSNDEERRKQVLNLLEEDKPQVTEARRLLAEMSGEERKLLKERQNQAQFVVQSGSGTAALGMMVACVLVLVSSALISRSITKPLLALRDGALRIGGGDYAHRVTVKTKDEVGQVASVFNQMAGQVHERQRVMADQTWLKTSLARFSSILQGQRDVQRVCQTVLDELARQSAVRHSVFYLPHYRAGEACLQLAASYACENPKVMLKAGEGLAGQCLLSKDQIVLDEVPPNYPKITSALGESAPGTVVVLPLIFEGEVKAVVELARLQRFDPLHLTLLEQMAPMLATILHNLEAGARTEQLLKESKASAEALGLHQIELSRKNAELEAQSEKLRGSEQQLQEQHEELRQANEELEQTNEEIAQAGEEMEEKAALLAEQKKALEESNHEMDEARAELEDKARQLSLTSKYKSEFLANMSHELRTPLNSLLILSKILAENAGGNLTPKQVQYAGTIHSSANDLLDLINDVLDLSKVESGTVEVDLQEVALTGVVESAEASFRHVAESKRLEFRVEIDPGLPPSITTDARRVQQIVTNLLSNAFKFTSKGSVTFKISLARAGWNPAGQLLNQSGSVVSLSVTDTGIGIPLEKQAIIFEAFQQAEAGTARKYGGTGLGLSISRELARLLGGSLSLESLPDRGSTFTLFLPDAPDPQALRALKGGRMAGEARRATSGGETHSQASIPDAEDSVDSGLGDDRADLQPGDLVLLIIEDDPHFARILMEFAREQEFKVVVAGTAAAGIALARQIEPAAVTLDLTLPDGDGWVVLDRLKHDSRTRHIPVHVISAREKRDRSLRQGAVSYLEKPVTKEALEEALGETIKFIQRPVKNLLVVEDDALQRQSIIELIGNGDVKTTPAATAAEAIAALEREDFDCIVMDLGLPDMSGTALIREIHKRHGQASPPVVVHTAKTLTREEETELRMLSDSIVIKDARSPERLLDETALFLHRVQSKLPEFKRRMLDQSQKKDAVLSGRKVLVVDDDIRNIFAITAALESHQMKVLYAESGSGALEALEKDPGIEAVLMDVMMPEMDGFEATRRVRGMERFKMLPIICVTAKAMKGDREKCLEAGASDYITKPIDMDQLRSLLRVWLYK